MGLTKQLGAVALAGALTLGVVGAVPNPVAQPEVAAAHTGHYTNIGRHWISLYVYEEGYRIQQVNVVSPFCWGGSTWIRTIDSRTGQKTRSDFKRCW